MNAELVKMFCLFHMCLKHNFFAKEQVIDDYASVTNVKMKVVVCSEYRALEFVWVFDKVNWKWFIEQSTLKGCKRKRPKEAAKYC